MSSPKFPHELIVAQQEQLNQHPLLVGGVIQTVSDLRLFMEFHVFAVWDFMSLVKSLQHHACPSGLLWLPSEHQRNVGRLINSIVLGEETDQGLDGEVISHYDLYVSAMKEVGADPSNVEALIRTLSTTKTRSLNQCLLTIPSPARVFCTSTFDVIATNKPHEIAAAFAFGRETSIPAMFGRLVTQLTESGIEAPTFKYYLDRHIEVDSGEHGPAAVDMVNYFCDGDPEKIQEAYLAATTAIYERMRFWDSIQSALEDVQHIKQTGVPRDRSHN